jgi:hypothetical protein
MNSLTQAIVPSSLLLTQSEIRAETNGNTKAITKKIPKVVHIIVKNDEAFQSII